ncbi:methylmalonyl-CoA epimerase, mitochondrial [Rhizophagus clarus]|uniref:Methylmalonyl-CoA epimerase, mitochondrial n=1 Tax=Rhizophagus clarus TaxID=94130 RepID=A0A8H3QXT8_9GLOM|nr:methylmalonyl-CoA epimerase, mitochondrial [Rhizophagus clarus]
MTLTKTLIPKAKNGLWNDINPQIEIVVTPRPSKHPIVTGTYMNLKQKQICVKNKNPDEIAEIVQLIRDNTGVSTKKRFKKPVISTTKSIRGANTSNISNDHPLWKLGHLNHVAIAVPNIDNAINFYKNILGVDQVSEAVPQPEHGVYTVFVNLGNTKIELLYPYGEKSPIQNFLEKNKNGGIHHICIEVNDVSNAVKDLLDKGIRPLDPEPKIGAHGNPVVFLHPKDCGGVLVELEQVNKKN